MRTLVTSLCAGAVLMAATAPAASADTYAPPEVPPGGVEFVDDPALVNAHPTRVEGWSRTDRDDAVAVHFTSGTPECYGAHAEVTEAPDSVTVALSTGTRADAVNRACIMIALSGTLEVPLQTPLGDRQVLSAS
ncbi:hypothetical protein [Mycolicibacterium sp. 120270]|uniref:hypothetical protein n=1 Tax=Mycolicibacterium sp. 120270 TaxID=3090600 RepID=UPI00299E286E|nr:hypothetical protein [Mycolicibacterium sp. 120270]MDX1882408.1 hypothetical protein [Mycolicibacterium sp. 120270]